MEGTPIITDMNGSINKLHRLTERDSRLAHYFGVWGTYVWAT